MSSSRRLIRFLTTTQIMRLYKTNVKRTNPTQLPLLESAVASPQGHKHYGQNDLFKLAGVLAERIILNHAYQDGNKRAALVAVDMFLKVNGYQLQKKPFGKDAADEDLKRAHVAVTISQWTAKDLAECYRGIAKPLGRATSEVEEYLSDSESL